MTSKLSLGAAWTLFSGGVLLLVFFWAIRTPRLERVWEFEQRLSLPKKFEPTAHERDVFQRTLNEYPSYAEELLVGKPEGLLSKNTEGWLKPSTAFLLRRPQSKAQQLVITLPHAWRKPASVCVDFGHHQECQDVEPGDSQAINLAPPSGKPELWRLKLQRQSGADKNARYRAWLQ